MAEKSQDGGCVPCTDVKTRDWYAWNDLQPPQPDYFHITGEVLVPNPGVEPLLVPTEPQGINPQILMLDLYLCQKPGFWPQVLVSKPVRYDKKITTGYTEVNIMCQGKIIARVKVDDIH
ncbi:MAG: hypothetical protein KDJ16_18190 [Hyphomicrobiales bacterium]|nr:hypothetical protein [Hyphomicrobiales bacterium]